MGEDCSFLVAFAAAPRNSCLPSVPVMWLLPIAVAMALIVFAADSGCSDEDAFGKTSSVRSVNGSVPSTTTIGVGLTSTATATFNTANTERGYGGSPTAAFPTCIQGRHRDIAALTRLIIQPSENRGGSDESPNSDSGGGSGVAPGSTLRCGVERSGGKADAEQREGRNSGGGVDWRERDEENR